jgi:CDP-glycerol glycerophosphotransferase
LVLLSIVVVADGPPGHLREVLASASAAVSPEVELVVVDGGRNTTTSWVIDGSVRNDVARVIRPERPLPWGDLHRLAAQETEGAHVLFLDEHTLLRDGAIDTIVERLREDHPDLLVLDARMVRWWEPRRSRRNHRILRGLPDGPFSWRNAPTLLRLPVDGAAEVVSRALLERSVTWMRGGAHAELVWRTVARLEALRVVAVPVPALERRARLPDGDHRSAATEEHAQLFTLAGALLRSLHQLGHEGAASSVVALTAARASSLLRGPARHWSWRERRRFFRAARRELGSVRSARAAAGGVRARLLLAGQHQLHDALEHAQLLRRRLRGTSATPDPVAAATSRIPGPLLARSVYRLALRLPLDRHLVVFAAYGYRSVACNPKAIHEELRRRAPGFRTVWILRHGVPAPPGLDVVRPRTVRYYYVLARAGYLVNNFNFPAHVRHRPGTVNVQTQHGSPFKTIGVDQHRFRRSRGRKRLPLFVEKYRRWDLVLSPSRYASEIISRAYPGRYRILEVGYPRNDVLVRGDPARGEATRGRLGIGDARCVVLYAPTFRDGERRFDSPLDIDAVAGKLDERDVLLVRAHYFLAPGLEKSAGEGGARVVDVSREPRIEDLYLAADALVTDYSSAMFDFALLGRPIVLHVPDLDRYRRRRGLYWDIPEHAPGPVTYDEAELVDALRRIADGEWQVSEQHRQFVQRFAEFDRGDAAKRVVEEVFLAQEQAGSIGSSEGDGPATVRVGST